MPNNSGERRSFGEKPGKRHTPGGQSFETAGAVEAWYRAERNLIDRMTEDGTLAEWLPPKERNRAARERGLLRG